MLWMALRGEGKITDNVHEIESRSQQFELLLNVNSATSSVNLMSYLLFAQQEFLQKQHGYLLVDVTVLLLSKTVSLIQRIHVPNRLPLITKLINQLLRFGYWHTGIILPLDHQHGDLYLLCIIQR